MLIRVCDKIFEMVGTAYSVEVSLGLSRSKDLSRRRLIPEFLWGDLCASSLTFNSQLSTVNFGGCFV